MVCVHLWPGAECGHGHCERHNDSHGVMQSRCVCDAGWIGAADGVDSTAMDCVTHVATTQALYAVAFALSVLLFFMGIAAFKRLHVTAREQRASRLAAGHGHGTHSGGVPAAGGAGRGSRASHEDRRRSSMIESAQMFWDDVSPIQWSIVLMLMGLVIHFPLLSARLFYPDTIFIAHDLLPTLLYCFASPMAAVAQGRFSDVIVEIQLSIAHPAALTGVTSTIRRYETYLFNLVSFVNMWPAAFILRWPEHQHALWRTHLIMAAIHTCSTAARTSIALKRLIVILRPAVGSTTSDPEVQHLSPNQLFQRQWVIAQFEKRRRGLPIIVLLGLSAFLCAAWPYLLTRGAYSTPLNSCLLRLGWMAQLSIPVSPPSQSPSATVAPLPLVIATSGGTLGMPPPAYAAAGGAGERTPGSPVHSYSSAPHRSRVTPVPSSRLSSGGPVVPRTMVIVSSPSPRGGGTGGGMGTASITGGGGGGGGVGSGVGTGSVHLGSINIQGRKDAATAAVVSQALLTAASSELMIGGGGGGAGESGGSGAERDTLTPTTSGDTMTMSGDTDTPPPLLASPLLLLGSGGGGGGGGGGAVGGRGGTATATMAYHSATPPMKMHEIDDEL